MSNPSRPPPSQSGFLQPWCCKKAQTCAKVLGILEIVVSFLGIIALVIVSMIVLDLQDEVLYIKQHPVDFNSQKDVQKVVLQKDRIFTLVGKFESHIPCPEVTETMSEYFLFYLNGTGVDIPTAETVSNLRLPEQLGFQCEIHASSKNYPYKKIEDKKVALLSKSQFQQYTIANIAALAVADHTNQSALWVEPNQFSLLPQKIGRVSQKQTHPNQLGYDPLKEDCVNDVIRPNSTLPEDVKDLFESVKNLLYSSATTSVLIGGLITTTAYDPTPLMLLLILCLEGVSIALISLALVNINDPTLCLLEYSGVSPIGANSPKYVQTIILYGYATYVALFKGYSVWFLLVFYVVARRLPRFPKTISKTQLDLEKRKELITSTAERVKARNEAKIEQQLEKQAGEDVLLTFENFSKENTDIDKESKPDLKSEDRRNSNSSKLSSEKTSSRGRGKGRGRGRGKITHGYDAVSKSRAESGGISEDRRNSPSLEKRSKRSESFSSNEDSNLESKPKEKKFPAGKKPLKKTIDRFAFT